MTEMERVVEAVQENGPIMVDTEPVVRCKNCKHYVDHAWIWLTDCSDICLFWNSASGVKVEPDGFCAWGEAK